MNKVKSVAVKVAHALASKEARGPEIALLRIIAGALGIKLGINFAEWAKGL